MNPQAAILARAVAVFLPAAIFLGYGAIHLKNGIAENGAFPVPIYISMNVPLPSAAYSDAAVALRHTDPRDGSARIYLAEAEAKAGESKTAIASDLLKGLKDDPSSSLGWTLFAEQLGAEDGSGAAQALEMAVLLAPYDVFLISRRITLASKIWPMLSDEAKGLMLHQVQQLWDNPSLRDEFIPLLSTSRGRDVVMQAFARDPGTLRLINRWLFQKQFGMHHASQ